ncbi:cytochrome P450 [Streptomyces tsukubensis]|uniref:cytochrome P450 n=1 Tax=Streptomyces tsukubensis TaxID=83656 RepID=UPI0036A8AA86
MTTPRSDVVRDREAQAPPPQCPAHNLGHDLGPEGLVRIYGPAAEANPQAMYERLRREYGPVAPVLLHGDLPAWLVLGHRENLEVMRTPSLYSRDSRIWTMFKEGRVPADSPLAPTLAWQPLCLFVDGEEHARLRGAVNDGLGQFNRHGIRRYVVRYTRQLVDAFEPRGEADLVKEYAEQLPMLVMTQLLGMPEENGPELVAAALDLIKGTESALASNEYVVQTLRRLVERKKEEPGRDLATTLLQHESGLTDDEVVEHLRLILVMANETTMNLIINTLRLVLTDGSFRASLSGGQMTLPNALDQVLWDAPPMSVIPGRWATGDTVLAGQQIKAGDLMMLGLAAGNVDPAIRPDPSASMYGNRSHLAFSNGPHGCPGQDIGRAIADTGIDAMLAMLPGLELAVMDSELPVSSAWLSQRIQSLPVRFTPRHALRTDDFHVSTEAHKAQPLPGIAVDPVAPAPASEPPAPSSWWRRLIGRARRRN